MGLILMTYHVFCPVSKKRFDFGTVADARKFALAIMKKFPDCKNVTIRDGNRIYARVWRANKMVYNRSKGRRKIRTVSETGRLRM